MRHVYILDNNDGSVFASLLMNDLNNKGIKFSNIKTTENINRNNILIYIPKTVEDTKYFDDFVIDDKNRMFHFKYILIVHKDKTSAITYKHMLSRRKLKSYITLDFDTLCSKIITDDCVRIMNRKRKFHNKKSY